ncbi:acyltransferase family protein [Vibrio aestuarianus]|uniref:acyltransferase family protein n=1 Tax=Vibrio aestuarianus TaxID=28171 RepID=UPI004067D33E
MQFRKDINGLRAIAVIAVVLFHFNASWMPGGFAGVDVFFVISGFLMTGIIFRGIEQENFSILKFYVARANRIIPALAILCLALLVFGWFYLTPLDYRALGKHVGSSMGFLSNIIYWRESGYFDAASHEKWLLHTWSLSAEWQFYIIYPLVLVAMRKFMSLKAMKAAVLVGTVLGFIFCVVATYKWPNPAYYLLPTRAWEMMIGGVAYLYPLKLAENKKKVFEWIGLTLIIFSYIFITKENLWPGYLALIPVFGAFLLIQAQRNDSFATGNIIFQSLGKWSYSIYLWHWPLVVAIYYFSLPEQFIYFGLILSVILGYISNRYVESIKFRNDFNGVLGYWRCKPLYMVIFIGLYSSSVYISINDKINSIPNNYIYDMASTRNGYCFTASGSKSNKGDKSNLSCFIGDNNKKGKVLSLGDSFMGHYEPLLKKIALDLDISIQSLTTGSCFPAFSKSDHYPVGNERIAQCLMNREFAKNNIEKFDAVIISTRWDEFYIDNKDYSDEVYKLIKFITDKGVEVIFLPVPTIYIESIGNKYRESIITGDKFNIGEFEVNRKKDQYNKMKSKELRDKLQGNKLFTYITKESFFPHDDFNYNGKTTPYSSDGGHISIVGAENIFNTIYNSDTYDKIKSAIKD